MGRRALRKIDPALDLFTLTREAPGRRLNPLRPDASLLLLKATAQVPHEGGRRFGRDSYLYTLLSQWVAHGTRDDTATVTAG